MKRAFGLTVASAVCLLSLPGGELQAADETIKQKWAVLVGVNDYAELEDLQFCRNDVKALAEQLVKAGFPRDNVFLLTDGAADAKDLPTKANIEARIKNVLSVAEEGQLVLVSFSGHGVHLGGKTYLCPTGARVSDPEGTMIQLLTVYDNLDRCKATRKLFWVDACRDDPRQGGSRSVAEHAKSTAGVLASLKAAPEGILTLASCATGQVSWEDEEFGHGVFMHYLLEGLSGKADREEGGNRNSRVSLLELYSYANIKTRRFVLKDKDKVQTPELFGRITGDFDIAEAESSTLAKDFTNTIGMKFKLIPTGEFLMGSPESEDDRLSAEGPQHRVRITKPFYLGVYEVTQAQYETVMGENPSRFEGGTVPVEQVTWEEAVEFCRKLSARDGRRYRLPTEAEWEYACRAGTTTPFAFGKTLSSRTDANFDGDSTYGGSEKGPDLEATAPVGSYRANALGLYDMHGNVYEWCADWYDSDYYENSPTDDPTGPTAGSYRVFRGGGWTFFPGYCRSASRYGISPGHRYGSLGFRVASVPVDASGR